MLMLVLAIVILALLSLSLDAFQPQPPSIAFAKRMPGAAPTAATTAGPLYAGFGGGGSSSAKSKKKEKTLKPKQQWDRYTAFKTEDKVRVAVRESDDEDWLEVGRIKSKNNEYTSAAVARQRALIAEHAKRLFPTKASNKQALKWAYFQTNGESDEGEWITVSKSVLDEGVPDNFEKLIGFVGQPDPATGFYCNYKDGKVVLE